MKKRKTRGKTIKWSLNYERIYAKVKEGKKMTKECLANLPSCLASCCRCVSFQLKNPTQDNLHYYRLHNCETIRMDRNIWKIVVPVKCSALTENNLCKLHGTDKKPFVCRALNEKTAHRFHKTSNCIYYKK